MAVGCSRVNTLIITVSQVTLHRMLIWLPLLVTISTKEQQTNVNIKSKGELWVFLQILLPQVTVRFALLGVPNQLACCIETSS